MKMSVGSLACRQNVFQWYHSEKHLSQFYPQDGIEITPLSPNVYADFKAEVKYIHTEIVNEW